MSDNVDTSTEQAETETPSSGVDALIKRLRDEGVAAGQAQAKKIVSEAEARADWILKQAKTESDEMLSEAQDQAERLQRSGEDALKIAARDMILQMKMQLMERFSDEVRRLISREMKREDFLQRLIVEVCRHSTEGVEVEDADSVEVLLPRDIVGLEDLRRNPEELEEGTLAHFVVAEAADLVREGISFGVSDDVDGGIRIRLVDADIEMDLTDEGVAAVLLQHLQPRFRALLEGIVK